MAQKFLLLFPNLLLTTTIVGGGDWLAAAPVTNVRTFPLAETARSTNALAVSTIITIDWGTALSARALIITRHNLSSAATVTWKRGTSAGGSQVGTSGAVNAWRFIPRIYNGAVYDVQILLAAATSARHETIEIVDTGNAAGFIEVGHAVIGTVVETAWNPAYGLRDGHIELSQVGRASSGAQWPIANRRPRLVKFALPFLTLAEGDVMHEMEQIEGTTEEVGYLPYSDTPARMQRYGMVGLLQELSGVEYPMSQTRGKGFSIEQRV